MPSPSPLPSGAAGTPVPPAAVVRPALDEFLAELTVGAVHAGLGRLPARGAVPAGAARQSLLLHVTAGRLECRVGGRRFTLAAGELLHVRRGESFALAAPDGDAAWAQADYQAWISGAVELDELVDFPARLPLPPGAPPGRYLVDAGRASGAGAAAGQRALLTLVLIALVRDQVPDAALLPAGRHVARLRRILPAVRRLRRDPRTAAPVAELARRCRVSVAQLCRLFHQVFGRSPSQYARQGRVRAACRLLRHTDLTVQAIARQVGYGQTSHFHRAFRQLTGMTPRGYRAAASATPRVAA
ncbi:MAG: helix-turn-helix transcriptional regulator [Opitutaceae bacterium]|nr:helix-turn-helix transcriptional regulator [Opitutaceae bacterium]